MNKTLKTIFMRIKKTAGFFFLLAISSSMVRAQSSMLTVQEAIRIGVENNYSIIIAENNQAAAKYARNIGNAGMLPTITIGGTASYSNTNVRQEQANGNIISSDAAVSTTFTGSAQLNWTLFDGLRMFAAYSRLTALRDQGEIRTRFEIENTISKIMQSYFDIVRNDQIYSSIIETINVGEERVTIAQKKFDIGSGSKTELLQSKIDLNNLRSQLFNQQILIYQSKTNLNQLLARDPATEFEVEDSIPVGNMLDLADIRKETLVKNSLVQISELDIKVNKMLRKEISSARYPWLSFNMGYNFNRNQNQAGFLLLNQNFGFNTGLSVSMNIFNSWRVNTQHKIATYNLENAQQNFNLVKLQTDAQVVNLFNQYSVYRNQAALQSETVNMAQENVTLSLERFKQGLSNFLELREAQQSYVEAVAIYTTALYNAKVQEIELMRLKGELIK
jgi:outer membrane protein